MEALLETYWPVILVALLVGIIVGIVIFRPKQSVRLSQEESPRRPHMDGMVKGVPDGRSHEGRGLVDAAAAGTADLTGQALQAEVHENLPGAVGEPDDLRKLKGVGPRLASELNAIGLVRFDQIAKLTPSQVDAIDARLGSFRGRLTRDRVVEQADYLARGDTDGYEARFGKL